MRTKKELRELLAAAGQVDTHVHTHLCDGAADMTVAAIGARAREIGIDTVVLTPHFHKQVSDETETLFTDSREEILLRLREEIEAYVKGGGETRFLLSTEADILSLAGETSLSLSAEAEAALDLVTPTMNYHPLLPLSMVHLTYGRDVNALHESGAYREAAARVGGVERVLETMYETEANAILRCPYPAMLGHFFAAHSVHPNVNTWFGAEPAHLPLMKEGAVRVIEACRRQEAILDLTGVHLKPPETAAERMEKNGFLVEFQQFVLEECRRQGVPCYAGSDAHKLVGIGRSHSYYARLRESARM